MSSKIPSLLREGRSGVKISQSPPHSAEYTITIAVAVCGGGAATATTTTAAATAAVVAAAAAAAAGAGGVDVAKRSRKFPTLGSPTTKRSTRIGRIGGSWSGKSGMLMLLMR